jgi:maltose/moltooligosaccharide transporter
MANALPWVFRQLGVIGTTLSGIPLTVQYSFKIGAVVFLLAVLWTVFTTKEYPPENIQEFERVRKQTYGDATGLAKIFRVIAELLREISSAFTNMPKTMKQLAIVQMFTWLGLFCMWMFFGLTTSYHVFGARNAGDTRFALGQEWGGNAFAIYSIVCFVIAFLLPKLAAATSRKTVHAISLICGGVGLLSVYFIQDKWVLLVTMVGVGIAWASILSMPYAILSGALPAARMGVYMGIFNFFIVIPEIIASLFFGRIIRAIFGPNSTIAPLYMVMAGGVFMLIAAALVTVVSDVADLIVPEEAVIEADTHELFTVPGSVQPVPSTGLIDEE